MAGPEFDRSSSKVKTTWDQQRRRQLHEWVGIKDMLIRKLCNNNNTTYKRLTSKSTSGVARVPFVIGRNRGMVSRCIWRG